MSLPLRVDFFCRTKRPQSNPQKTTFVSIIKLIITNHNTQSNPHHRNKIRISQSHQKNPKTWWDKEERQRKKRRSENKMENMRIRRCSRGKEAWAKETCNLWWSDSLEVRWPSVLILRRLLLRDNRSAPVSLSSSLDCLSAKVSYLFKEKKTT